MVTKAQRFRSAQERSKPPRPKQTRRKKANAGTKKARGTQDATMNIRGALKGATVTLEPMQAGPTRKSTRKSAQGQKPSTARERAIRMKLAQAGSRHKRRRR